MFKVKTTFIEVSENVAFLVNLKCNLQKRILHQCVYKQSPEVEGESQNLFHLKGDSQDSKKVQKCSYAFLTLFEGGKVGFLNHKVHPSYSVESRLYSMTTRSFEVGVNGSSRHTSFNINLCKRQGSLIC